MVPYGFKRCSKCGEVKAVVLFSKDLSSRDGFHSQCKACRKADFKAYYEANKDAVLERKKFYRETNKEAIVEYRKAYYEANKEAIVEKKKAYYQANKAADRERTAARKAKKKKNTPKFLLNCPVDKQRRVFAYNLARLLTETTGVEHHVDHMWPISDGGPHWSGNLQVIPAVDNLSKHASVDEEIKKTIKEGLEYAKRESK